MDTDIGALSTDEVDADVFSFLVLVIKILNLNSSVVVVLNVDMSICATSKLSAMLKRAMTDRALLEVTRALRDFRDRRNLRNDLWGVGEDLGMKEPTRISEFAGWIVTARNVLGRSRHCCFVKDEASILIFSKVNVNFPFPSTYPNFLRRRKF